MMWVGLGRVTLVASVLLCTHTPCVHANSDRVDLGAWVGLREHAGCAVHSTPGKKYKDNDSNNTASDLKWLGHIRFNDSALAENCT